MRRGFHVSGLFVFGFFLALATLVWGEAQAKFTVLHAFRSGADGANPFAPLILDSTGNLYGTTKNGGSTGCGGQGCGTEFEVQITGTVVVVDPFNCTSNGSFPEGGLLLDSAGNLFGTTSAGPGSGAGTVFEIPSAGIIKQLHAFSGSDGSTPVGGLIMDAQGNLYGTTSAGSDEAGTIFKTALDGTTTVLHSFFGSDGFAPEGGLIADKSGNFYGTASAGGANGDGTVFECASDGTYTVLYSFNGGSLDGVAPFAGLVRDGSGNLYGTTRYGGSSGCGGSGCGTVFKLAPGGTETLLHAFAGGGGDGATPLASLVRDKSGNLYGTTKTGGGTGCGGSGCGTVFKLAPGGTETLLHAFTGGSDGNWPVAGLVAKSGILYGTASAGGKHGFGTVFALKE